MSRRKMIKTTDATVKLSYNTYPLIKGVHTTDLISKKSHSLREFRLEFKTKTKTNQPTTTTKPTKYQHQ